MPRKQKTVQNPEEEFRDQEIENEAERERDKEKEQEKEPVKEQEKEPVKEPEKEQAKEPEKEPVKEPGKAPEKAPGKNADYTIEKADAAGRKLKDDTNVYVADKARKGRLDQFMKQQERKKAEQAAKEKEQEKPPVEEEKKPDQEKDAGKKEPEKKEEEKKEPEKKEQEKPEQEKPEPEKKEEEPERRPDEPEPEYDFGDDVEEEADLDTEMSTAQKLQQLEQRRKQLEEEEAEFRRQEEAKKPVPKKPEAKKQGKKKQDEKKQEPKDLKKTEDQLLDDDVVRDNRKNPYKDEVTALKDIQDTTMSKQWKEVRALRAMTRVIDKKSKEYKVVRKHLRALDDYLKMLRGRTQLTKEEMEKYELLTMRALKASDNYEKAERERLKKSGKKPTRQEEQRLRGIKEIRRSVTQLRSEMYENELKRRKEEMEKKCQEKLQDMQETLDGLHKTGAKSLKLREQLGGAVTRTLFYMNRMDSLASSFHMKEGEAYPHTMKRLNRDLKPTKKDFQNVAKHELTKSIVDAGMKAIKDGDAFTTEDVKRLQKEYLRKHARRLMQERKRREQIRNLGRKSQRVSGPTIPKPGNVL